MTDFIYQREVAPCGVAVEEIYGADEKSAKVWKLFAMQIFSESEGDYRSLRHLENGAPMLEDIPQRISISHTPHHLVVASIPKTPDINLDEVNVRTAIGVDIEKSDRTQVLKVRDKYLNPREQSIIEDDDVKANILAWTCKEALYKSIMGTAPDWKEDYQIISMPQLANDIKQATKEKYGKGLVRLADGTLMELNLSSWQSEGHIITLAFSSKIPIYK
ncbi:MAG: 4'-phosphopantetheinyl transferase superfamily protein [Muribaculum sp.]|nr:4'-phosphopantetheinyl transferase superfamily protein [Muribaculum sp.]